MDTPLFRNQPLAVKLATCLSFFMAWVLTAEFVIDRYGFDHLLPYYRVGDICPYEFIVLAAIGLFWWRTHARSAVGR